MLKEKAQAAKAAPSSTLYGPKASPCPRVLPPLEGVLHAEPRVTGSANLFQSEGDQSLSTNAAAGIPRTPFSILHTSVLALGTTVLWMLLDPVTQRREKPSSFQSVVQGCGLGVTSPGSPAPVPQGAWESTAVMPSGTHLHSHEQLGVG